MNRTNIAAVAFAMLAASAVAMADSNGGPPAQTGNFNGWMGTYSKAHNGRISKDAYMEEAGRRWDSADIKSQGLTAAEINRVYGSNTPITGAATPAAKRVAPPSAAAAMGVSSAGGNATQSGMRGDPMPAPATK